MFLIGGEERCGPEAEPSYAAKDASANASWVPPAEVEAADKVGAALIGVEVAWDTGEAPIARTLSSSILTTAATNTNLVRRTPSRLVLSDTASPGILMTRPSGDGTAF